MRGFSTSEQPIIEKHTHYPHLLGLGQWKKSKQAPMLEPSIGREHSSTFFDMSDAHL